MDSLSQLALGAAVGYAVAGKSIGKKAFVLGAIAGTLPDLDFIFAHQAHDDFRYLNIHRGFSHSLLGSITLPFIWTGITRLFQKKLPKKPLYWLFFWGALTHLVLDAFTSWGTQVFWPLWYRVAFNSIFIIDPLYTLLLGIPLVIAITKKKAHKAVWVGLIASSCYLLLGLGIKHYMNDQFSEQFIAQDIPVSRFITRPTPFNTILWSVTAETNDAYLIGYRSLLDKKPETNFYRIPKNKTIPTQYQTAKVAKLRYWMRDFYTVIDSPTGLLLADLRYGTLGDPRAVGLQYVFRYHITLSEKGSSLVTIQNPQDTDPKLLLHALLSRLKGH